MFIHASEIDSRGEPVKDNIQIMGLQLPNYVPVGDQCATSSSWEGGCRPGGAGGCGARQLRGGSSSRCLGRLSSRVLQACQPPPLQTMALVLAVAHARRRDCQRAHAVRHVY